MGTYFVPWFLGYFATPPHQPVLNKEDGNQADNEGHMHHDIASIYNAGKKDKRAFRTRRAWYNQCMNVAIIGGGFTGLTAAYELLKKGHQVTVFERDTQLGGLAHGFKENGWDWHLENAYHHLFTNDHAIIGLINELGLTDTLLLTRPITASYYNGAFYQLDSPIRLLQFPLLSLFDRLRTGALIAAMKLNPFWQPLENITAEQLFTSIGGKRAWQTLWQPLMIGKFGDFAPTVAASWLWARIKKRTPRLYYIEGGFHTVVETLAKEIKNRGGTIHTNASVSSVQRNNATTQQRLRKTATKLVVTQGHKKGLFDTVLLTVPTPIAAKLLATHNSHLTTQIPHLHAQTLILETRSPILHSIYWLNVTDRSFPFLAVVAHTNMIDTRYYGGCHITYFGNYLPDGHPYLAMTKAQIFKTFLPYIKRLNPSFRASDVRSCRLFIGLYAQPVHELHYSARAAKFETRIPNVYLANLDSIYPWDRGTNYAVELGKRAAQSLMSFRP